MKKYWETGEKNDFGKECYKLHFSQFYEEDDGSVVAYDENTKVMYLCIYGYNSMAITPIYNSDGTVKLYDGE